MCVCVCVVKVHIFCSFNSLVIAHRLCTMMKIRYYILIALVLTNQHASINFSFLFTCFLLSPKFTRRHADINVNWHGLQQQSF